MTWRLLLGSLPPASCLQPNPEPCIAGFGANAPEISISGFTVRTLLVITRRWLAFPLPIKSIIPL